MIPWIKSQAEKFLGSPESPYYKKLKPILKRERALAGHTRIYFLGGFEHSGGNYERFRALRGGGAVKKFLSEVKYNAQADNVELYLIERGNASCLLALLDSVELYSPEQVLQITESPGIDPKDFEHELVYP